MSIIAISRGSYRRGKEVAETVAKKLGYACIDRDLLIDEMEEFHLPEIKMVRNILDATSVLDRFSHGKERYIGSIKAAILKHCQKNNIVYHGLAGHFFVRDVSHAFKVRIISDLETRVREEMEREGIPAREARYILKKDDEERRKWALYLYGIDIKDSSLYDMVINISAITVDDAVDIIANGVNLACFRPTPESQKRIDDMALGALTRVALFEYPNAAVRAVDGKVQIGLKAPVDQKDTITANIERILKTVEGVKEIEVHLEPYF